jgi:hypothetical protein
VPFVLAAVSAVLILSAIRDTQGQLASLLVHDFTGSGSFLMWLAAIVAVGLLGYSPSLKTPSRLLLALIVLGILLSNQGVFAKLQQAVAQPAAPSTPPPDPSTQLPNAFPVQVSGTGAGGSILSSIFGSVAKAAIGGVTG